MDDALKQKLTRLRLSALLDEMEREHPMSETARKRRDELGRKRIVLDSGAFGGLAAGDEVIRRYVERAVANQAYHRFCSRCLHAVYGLRDDRNPYRTQRYQFGSISEVVPIEHSLTQTTAQTLVGKLIGLRFSGQSTVRQQGVSDLITV